MKERPITGVNSKNATPEQILLGANKIDIILLTNWGHSNYIGLTSIEIIEGADNVVPLNDFNILTNNLDNQINLNNLFNGDNLTTNSDSMWLIPFEENNQITINLNDCRYISGLKKNKNKLYSAQLIF